MRSGAVGDQARDSWAQAYRDSEYYKGSSNGQHFGACPHCGGEDRFWIHFTGEHASTFSCRQCEPRKGTPAAADIARKLNELAGHNRASGGRWQILRQHEYRTTKGKVRHVKGIPPNETKPTIFWQHYNGSRWVSKLGGKIQLRDLLWNHWTVKPEHTRCVVCEGEKDATLLYKLLEEALPDTCFVSGGGGADNPAMNLAPLAHIAEFFVLFDADKAGRKGAEKYARYIQTAYPKAKVLHYAPPGESGEDWADVIEKARVADAKRERIIERVTEELVDAMNRASPPSRRTKGGNGEVAGQVLDIGGGAEDYDYMTIPLGWTDAEIADWILTDKLGARQENGLFLGAPVIYDKSQAEWYFCREGVWREADFPKVVAGFMEEARRRVAREWPGDKEKLLKVLSSNFQREQVLKVIQRYVAERGERVFDQNSWLVCGKPPDFSIRDILSDPTGKADPRPAQVWDLQTGLLRDAVAGDYIRHTLGTSLPRQSQIDPMEQDAGRLGMHIAADCPEFWQLLTQISSYIPDIDAPDVQPQSDRDWMLHMCEWIGQCLTADTSPEQFLFLTGTGSNGKGLLTELLLKLAGSLGHVAPDGLLNPRRTAHRQEQAVLEGKHLLIADEQKARIDTGLLKNWSGGTPITADHKGGKSITFPVKFTIVLLSNRMPRFPSAGEAMGRRLVGIPFDMKFKYQGGHFRRRSKADIFRSIQEELPRIAYLCLSMYRAVTLRGNLFSSCARVDAKSTELLLAMNRIQEWIETCLHIGPDHSGVPTKDMYASYKAFMKENNYRGVLPTKTFTAEVRAVAFRKDLDIQYRRVGPRNNRARGFRGCSLRAKFPGGGDRDS